MTQLDTDGYGARLAEALQSGPRPMSVRRLAREMGSKDGPYEHLRGTSYGGIRQYVEGKITKPRVELLRAMADVLEVSPDWLAFNKGPMTEAGKRTRRALEAPAQEWDWQEAIQVVQEEFGDGDDRIAEDPLVRMVVLGSWARLMSGRLHPRLPPDDFEEIPLSGIAAVLAGYMRIPKDPAERRTLSSVGRFIGQALRAPFNHLTLRPDDLSDDEFLDYVTSICQGLYRLADAQRRRGADPHHATD